MTPSRRAVLAGLAAAVAGPAATLRAASGAPPVLPPALAPALPAALAGAFVPWAGPRGREAGLAAWEAWLGRPSRSVPALDYWGKDDWGAVAAALWLPGFWARVAPGRPLVWSIPLTVPGTPLAAVAAGRHDADFGPVARAIAAARPDAMIRLGWEMNVRTMAWFAGADPAAFREAFRRVAGLFRSASPRFSLDWCPSWGPQDGPAELFYPGDDVVDVVGLDVYDYRRSDEPVARRWAEAVVEAPFGLAWQARFAAARGKAMSLPEWGVGEAGDDPAFVEALRAWFGAHAGRFRYACYFDVDGLWPTRISDGRFPAARAAVRRGFGA